MLVNFVMLYVLRCVNNTDRGQRMCKNGLIDVTGITVLKMIDMNDAA